MQVPYLLRANLESYFQTDLMQSMKKEKEDIWWEINLNDYLQPFPMQKQLFF